MSTKNYFLKKRRKQPTTSGHIKEPYFELAARTWLGTEQRGEGHRISGSGEACRQPTAPSRALLHCEDTPGPARLCRAALSALHPLGTVRLTSHPLPAGRRAPRCSGSPSPRCGEALGPGKVRGAGTHTLRAVLLPSELTLPRAFLPCPAAGNSVINTTEYFIRDSKETW